MPQAPNHAPPSRPLHDTELHALMAREPADGHPNHGSDVWLDERQYSILDIEEAEWRYTSHWLVPNTIECSLDDWFKAYDPLADCLKQQNRLNIVLDKLRNGIPLLDDDGWMQLREATEMTEHDTAAFLKSIVERMKSAVRRFEPNLRSTAHARPFPSPSDVHNRVEDHASCGYRRALLCNPDSAVIIPGGQDDDEFDGPLARSMVACGEFEVGDDERTSGRNDHTKPRAGMSSVMRIDRSCRHAFAFTVTDGNARLWHFSRSHVTVCAPFDIHKHPQYLVSFLYLVTYGSRQDLRLDDSVAGHVGIKVNPAIGLWRYTVEGQQYDIVEPTGARIGPQRIMGWNMLARRVRKCQQGDETGCAPKEDLTEDSQQSPEQHSLHILHYVTPSASLNSVHHVTLRSPRTHGGQAPRSNAQASLISAKEHRDWKQLFGSPPCVANRLNATVEPTNSGSRPDQSRTDSNEIGRSVYDLSDFGALLRCLNDSVAALKNMTLVGYAHCDKSPGNALHYERRGILTALEWEVEYGTYPVSDPTMGTPNFSALAYQAKSRLFGCPPSDPFNPEPDEEPYDWFCLHSIHDLESIYWQYLWYIFHCIPSCITLSEADRERLVTTRRNYFTDRMNLTSIRQRLLTMETGWHKIVACFRHPYGVHNLIALLRPISLAGCLRTEYTRIDKVRPEKVKGREGIWTYPRDLFTKDIYNNFQESLLKTMQFLSDSSYSKSLIEHPETLDGDADADRCHD